MLVKERIAQLVQAAATEAVQRGLLPSISLPDVLIQQPQNPEHGDYATNVALKLARAARKSPLEIARTLADTMPQADEIAETRVAPPGFINFVLSDAWLKRQVVEVLSAGDDFGSSTTGAGQSVQVEFVSANPTGPIHVGHGRGAVLGSTLANVLSAAGYNVQREYYINDAGSQIEAFRRSLWARYQQALGVPAEMPAEGYVGAYMVELGQAMAGEHGRRFLEMPEEQGRETLGEIGLQKMLAEIRQDLARLSVDFDVWFSERTLFSAGQYDRALRLLRERNVVREKEGALWFASTALGDDKDAVLVRSSGLPTYFASDVAYHYNKFVERHFQRVINIWGADHQGHVPRMKAVVSALGVEPSRLEVVISQLVTLKRGDQTLRLSKRTGDIITLREVLDEVGPDACRYFFLTHSADSQMDFDLELAKKQSQDNPVYYVQYAHARIHSILRNAAEQHIAYVDGDVQLLRDPAEMALVRKMLLLPELIEDAALSLEPHRLPHYAHELATAFHGFYQNCRVISPDPALTAARLKLVDACRIVLARTLKLMGMSAPERM
ncbi:MAG: arginine--tRNA ligase [Dehalococcoidia bacterium]|nr:arginine--tRNA ligase [Dehalococcoidia bacterium]